MIDFTIRKYSQLLLNLRNRFEFIPFKSYLNNSTGIILRHDVDLLPENSLKIATLESSLGILGTYYFRKIPEVYDRNIITKIQSLGHEIGYHYEEIDIIYQRRKKNNNIRQEELIDEAYELFCKNLIEFRKFCDIVTICMHGSPLSPFNNINLWQKYSYKPLGIIGEPYLDLDWSAYGYLTDTGRKWNACKESIRDRVESKYTFNFRGTDDILDNVNLLPEKLMITVHPQRWTDNYVHWSRELILQGLKNIIKRKLYEN